MTSRLDIANDMDALDQSIADLNASKAEMWSDYREGLIARGMAKDAARAEVAALKAAIRRRRAVTKDSAAVEEMDALVDEIFSEISRTAHGAREYSEAAE